MTNKYAYAAILALFLINPAFAQSEGLTFKGYDCISACEFHKQGYDWAKENVIEDKEDCVGPSTSIIQGCYAWVEEQEELTGEADGYYTFPDEGVIILE